MKARRAVFLDRDGVLVHNVFYADTEAWEAPRTLSDFRLVAAAPLALKRLLDAGFELILVSNQPNVALGKSTHDDLAAMDRALVQALGEQGVTLLERCYCLHHPRSAHAELGGRCNCRKPSPYWIDRAAERYELARAECWMIGDRETDSECAAQASVRAIRVVNAQESGPLAAVSDSYALQKVQGITEAVEVILSPPAFEKSPLASPERRAFSLFS